MKLTQKQLEFILQSNKIDWNTVDPNMLTLDVVKRASEGDADTPQEIRDHIEAFRQMLAMAQAAGNPPPVPQIVIPLHATLTKNILAPEESGKFRRWGVWIGNEICPRWFTIPAYMERMTEQLKYACRDPGVAWALHNEFECVHPFSDGNGRTGRLLLNFCLLRSVGDITVVKYSERIDYYGRIQAYRRVAFVRLPENDQPPEAA